MSKESFSTTFAVDSPPESVFDAINSVRAWWSEDIEGRTDRLGSTFTYRNQEVHRCTMEIVEHVPGRRIVWRVVDNFFNFTQDQTEWQGTHIVFEIAGAGKCTEVRFSHRGLVPNHQCYDVCSSAWSAYIGGSLRALIETGRGRPNGVEPRTARGRAEPA